MKFNQVIEILFSKRPADKPGSIDAMRTASPLLGNPEKAFPAIHVTGTNGKGSVTHKIARALQSAGLRVGLYTSPHLISFCERIQINGVPIPEETARLGLLKLFELEKKLFFFEIATLLAFEYFRDNKVDIAIVEVGIGGRHDATNIVQPILSIITSVACDHEDLLGSTLEKIAYEKAGIIKLGIPVVIGPKADFAVIRETAAMSHSPLYKVEAEPGFYDVENTAIARKALEILPYQCQDIETGLKSRPACRFEQIGNVIFDVAHNPAGICRLLEAIEFHFPGRPFSVLIGMSRDKDVRKCLKMLAEKASHLYLVPSPALKAMSVEEMVEILRQDRIACFTAGLTIQENIAKALTAEELLVVCGSFYIMKEAREEVVRIQVAHDQFLLSRGQSIKQ
jgi:dihydrofolate synthase/folylpolyglutamate synthase